MLADAIPGQGGAFIQDLGFVLDRIHQILWEGPSMVRFSSREGLLKKADNSGTIKVATVEHGDGVPLLQKERVKDAIVQQSSLPGVVRCAGDRVSPPRRQPR